MDKLTAFVKHKLPSWRSWDGKTREMVGGTSIALLLKGLGAALTFGFHFALARSFGAEGAGLFFLAMSLTTLAGLFGRMGLETVLMRTVASRLPTGDAKGVWAACRAGLALVLVFSLTASALLFGLARPLALWPFHKPELAGILAPLALTVTPMALVLFYGEMLKGLKRLAGSMLVSGLAVPLLSLLFLMVLKTTFGLQAAVAATLLASLLAALGGWALWRRLGPAPVATHSLPAGELLKSGVPLFWLGLADQLSNLAPLLVLGIFGSARDLGVFGAASKAVLVTGLIITAVNGYFAPRFAEYHHRGEWELLSKAARSSARMTALLGAFPLAAFLFFPSQVLSLFGPGFSSGAACLAVLGAGQLVNVLTGSVGNLLTMSGNEKLARNNSLATSVLSLVLSFLLIPSWGALGAALSMAACGIFWNLLSAWRVWSRLGILALPVDFNPKDRIVHHGAAQSGTE